MHPLLINRHEDELVHMKREKTSLQGIFFSASQNQEPQTHSGV